jgi:nitric oxide reductase subunit C
MTPPRTEAFPDRDPGLPRFALLAGVLAIGLALVFALRPALPEPERGGAVAVEALPGGGDDPDPVAAGREVFLAQGCGGCHAVDPAAGGGGPALVGLWSRAELRLAAPDYQGGARDAETYLREAVLDHCLDPLPGYSCPDLEDLAIRLSVGEVDALLAYLRSAGGGDPASTAIEESQP